MSEQHRAVAARNAGFVLEALGRKWTLSKAKQTIKASFELWMEQQAEKDILSKRELRGEEETAEQLERFEARRDAGEFGWKRKIWSMRMRNGTGVPALLTMLLEPFHPEATEELAKEIINDNPKGVVEVLRKVLDDSPNSEPEREAPETV